MTTDHPSPSEWYSQLADGRIRCELCPRMCTMRDGQRGFCFVRAAENQQIVLKSYGRASGFCIDPIEKKPLNHFFPGTSVLSFGTAGCNLGCHFCQNHDVSKAREMDLLMDSASPRQIAEAASSYGCRSVAFTYNDPVIFAEYAIDCAIASREMNIHPVAVTAGYIHEKARDAFFRPLSAANIDLKSFDEGFYRKLTLSSLQPVLETLKYVTHETDVWLEITTLLIPGKNDSEAEIHALVEWILDELNANIPLHFTAFHPDYRMLNTQRTPSATLNRAKAIAKKLGLRHVYTGNVHDRDGQSTYCHACGHRLIGRNWYELDVWHIANGHCNRCHTKLAGHFDPQPGNWGAKRQPIRLGPNPNRP